MNIGGIVFPLEEQSRDQESVVYHAKYDTEGVPHTKSGDRQPVQVSIEVRQQLILACFSCFSVKLTLVSLTLYSEQDRRSPNKRTLLVLDKNWG